MWNTTGSIRTTCCDGTYEDRLVLTGMNTNENKYYCKCHFWRRVEVLGKLLVQAKYSACSSVSSFTLPVLYICDLWQHETGFASHYLYLSHATQTSLFLVSW